MESNFLTTAVSLFKYYKTLVEKAITQIDDSALHWKQNEESNSIAIIMNHISGNMLSRWTDFLESDGEKPWRQRDKEFEDNNDSRETIMINWEKGWTTLFNAIMPLKEMQMSQIVYIRNEGHTVMEAIMRQLAHYTNHCGQIILLAKMLSDNWKSLTIPKNKSVDFNQQLFKEAKTMKDFTIAASNFIDQNIETDQKTQDLEP